MQVGAEFYRLKVINKMNTGNLEEFQFKKYKKAELAWLISNCLYFLQR